MPFGRLYTGIGAALLLLAALFPSLPVLTAPLDYSPGAILLSPDSGTAFLFGIVLGTPFALAGAAFIYLGRKSRNR